MMKSLAKNEKLPENKRTAIVTTICKLCYIYNDRLNGLAKIQGLRLLKAGCSKNALGTSNQLYDCVSYWTILRIMDHFALKADEQLQEIKREVVHIGDNVDKRLSARHESSSKTGKDFHFYNNMLYLTRIDTSHLSDVPPEGPKTVEEVDFTVFIPNETEQKTLIDRLHYVTCDVWKNVTALHTAADALSQPPAHKYEAEMKQKSVKVRFLSVLNLGIFIKNSVNSFYKWSYQHITILVDLNSPITDFYVCEVATYFYEKKKLPMCHVSN